MHAKRLSRLQAELRKRRVPAFLVTQATNIRYLTGLHASTALLLVTTKSVILFVDSRYTEIAKTRAEKIVTVADPSEIKKFLTGFSAIGFESESVTVARLERFKTQLKNKKFVPLKDLVEGLRRVKDSGELQKITAACALTKKALRRVPKLLRYGMTERDLALELFIYCTKNGAEAMAFETIVGFGENTSKPHHRPTDRRLKKGDIVQIDMGVVIQGYCSDYSRVYFTAAPTDAQKKAYRALKEAKKSAETLLRPGVLNTALDTEARRVLRDAGYEKEFSHSLGHGVGLDIHEGAHLSTKAPPMKILKNEVVTIEPGLYFEGQWGMRLEDTWIVT